jgi:hypothetical protein
MVWSQRQCSWVLLAVGTPGLMVTCIYGCHDCKRPWLVEWQEALRACRTATQAACMLPGICIGQGEGLDSLRSLSGDEYL